MKKLFNKIIYFFLFFFVNAAVFLDSYKYPGFFEKHFFVDSKILFVLFIFYLIIFFLKNKKFFQNKLFKSFNLTFAALSLVIMSAFSLLEFSHYENYVYNLFHINHAHFLLFFFEGAFLLFLTFADWFLKKLDFLIVLLFLVFFLTGLFAYTFQSNLFIEINKEDSLIETLQFFVVFVASLFSLFLAFFYKKQNKVFFFIFYLLGAAALFFIAGDEISWGQRVFNYQTPEAIVEYTDQQNETSWHNSQLIARLLGDVYLLISIYGSFTFIIYEFCRRFFKKFEPIVKHFLILMPASLFFMARLAYDLMGNVNIFQIDLPFKLNAWSEYTELSMYLGIFIQFFLIYYRQVKKKENYGKN